MTQPTPLQRYAAVQKAVDRELAAILRDAAAEGERILASLSGNSVTTAVTRAQISVAVRELRHMQAEMWGYVTDATRDGMVRAGDQAAEAENYVNRQVFKLVGMDRKAFEHAMKVRAQAAVKAYQARMDNGISLSQQVYKTRALTSGQVDRIINRSLLLGHGWEKIADNVRRFINPNVPGGVSYAAKRLARTEINNAFHRVQIDQRKDSPFTEGFQWHLSGSHPRPDDCNDYAERSTFHGGGPGVWRVDEVPGKPHPNCLCYLTTVLKDEATLYQEFLNGRYNSYLDDVVGNASKLLA